MTDNTELKEAILKLGEHGCQGNIQDYGRWLEFHEKQKIPYETLVQTLDSLIRSGEFRLHPDIPSEYVLAKPVSFPDKVEYCVSGVLQNSPIQMVRSRLECFLQYHGVCEESIMDISIGVTEAMENAVKYSDHKEIQVSYEIQNDVFHIRVVNRIGEVILERDIRAGKYSGTGTLMRGMMVMDKLFDEFFIDLQEEKQLAIFSATKKITPSYRATSVPF